jgi:immune inhibitor A
MVSTDDDRNGNLSEAFGGLKNGLTGDSGDYRHDYINLTPCAGTTMQLRLGYLTDPFFEERGWLADDSSVTTGGTTVSSDDVEGGLNGWTAEGDSWPEPAERAGCKRRAFWTRSRRHRRCGAPSTAMTRA